MHPFSRAPGWRAPFFAALLLSAVTAACTGRLPEARSLPVAQLSFRDTVEVVAADGEARPDAGAPARDIIGIFTTWYGQAFLDAGAWDDPSFPRVVERFSDGAKAQARSELDALTIGKARKEVFHVKPVDASIKITLYVGPDDLPEFAVADVVFQAAAKLKKKGPPLRIVQRGVYYLRLEGSDWKIFSYQARADQTQVPLIPPVLGQEGIS